MSCAPSSLSCSIVLAPSFSYSFHSLAILDQLKEDFCGFFLTIVFILSDFLVFCSGFLVISSILTFNYWFLYFGYFMMANSQELFLTLWSLCRLLILFYECNIFYYVTGDIICNLLEFCSASGLPVSCFTFPLFFLTVYLVLAVPGPRWCTGASLLVESRATLRLWCRPLPEVASAAGEQGFSGCRARAQPLRSAGLWARTPVVLVHGPVALLHTGSSWTRDPNPVSCTGRRIPHWATLSSLSFSFVMEADWSGKDWLSTREVNPTQFTESPTFRTGPWLTLGG